MKEKIQETIDKYEKEKKEHLEYVRKYSLPNMSNFFDEILRDLGNLKTLAEYKNL